jgi:hypothetical protein
MPLGCTNRAPTLDRVGHPSELETDEPERPLPAALGRVEVLDFPNEVRAGPHAQHRRVVDKRIVGRVPDAAILAEPARLGHVPRAGVITRPHRGRGWRGRVLTAPASRILILR